MKRTNDPSKLPSLIFVLGRMMREELYKKARKSSSSFLHYQTLRYIKEEERPFMRDVARYLLITPPAATLLIDGLVKQGFLNRIVDKRDRRAVRIGITKKGDALLARGTKDAQYTLASLFKPLSEKEREQFMILLEKLIKSQ